MTRDEAIVASYKSGTSRADIAREFSISGERVSQILSRYNVPRQRKQHTSRTKRIRNVYMQLRQYKEEHDGNTYPVRKLARLDGNHVEGVYAALEALEDLGLVRREQNGDVVIVGGKWIPPEEPNWEELLA